MVFLVGHDSMHARELVELAAIVSAHGPTLIEGRARLSRSGIQQYWTASKARLDRWGQSLRRFQRAADHGEPKLVQCAWCFTRGVLEEVLTGEVLTRVWAAVLCEHDRRHGTDDASAVARSVLIGHLEARNRVLSLLVHGTGIPVDDAARLNQLRLRCESWTDMLVGYLSGVVDPEGFAVDPGRARDFAEDLSARGDLSGGRHAWPLVRASVQTAFREGMASASPNEDLNEQIASAVLACIPADLIDASGALQSVWLRRMMNVSEDAQTLLDELLSVDDSFLPALAELDSLRLDRLPLRDRPAGEME